MEVMFRGLTLVSILIWVVERRAHFVESLVSISVGSNFPSRDAWGYGIRNSGKAFIRF